MASPFKDLAQRRICSVEASLFLSVTRRWCSATSENSGPTTTAARFEIFLSRGAAARRSAASTFRPRGGGVNAPDRMNSTVCVWYQNGYGGYPSVQVRGRAMTVVLFLVPIINERITGGR